jgi:hypothetical protein
VADVELGGEDAVEGVAEMVGERAGVTVEGEDDAAGEAEGDAAGEAAAAE